MKTFQFLALLGIWFWIPVSSLSQQGLPAKTPVTATITTNFPQHEDFKESLLARLKVPAGMKVTVVASGLGKPRMMELAPDGSLYITRRDQGDVLLLTDKDKDGKFDEMKPVVVKFNGVHGIAIKDSFLFLCSNRELKRYSINADNTLRDTVTLFTDLPDGGQHPNRTLGFGPDGKLYISVGSTCNDCNESNPENATILQVDLQNNTRKIYARGLRNTIGFDWHPDTGELWGMDNGSDSKGDNTPPEELNKIVDQGDYGWPFIYGKQIVDKTREEPPGTTKEEYAKKTVPSTMDLPAHAAPINFKFLRRSNLPAYKDAAIVTWHGSWNKSKPDGFKVQLVHFKNGEPTKAEDLLKGFLSPDGRSRFGRPAGIAVSGSGVIYISDDANGIIYSISANN
jgi:glucose/arabinose dehydrogenase